MKQRVIVLLSAVFLLAGCATHIRPTVASNPPPTHALKDYGAFEVKPVASFGNVDAAALAKIQENLDLKVGALVAGWNRGSGGMLVIEPRIRELKFVSAGKRVLAGAMAGSSAVRMSVRLSDKQTGEVIAEPEFYQRAAAIGGAWSFGGSDNAMLVRIATVVEEYLRRNYDHAVGGPTGLEASSS